MLSQKSKDFLLWILKNGNQTSLNEFLIDSNKMPNQFKGEFFIIKKELEQIGATIKEQKTKKGGRYHFYVPPITKELLSDNENLSSIAENTFNGSFTNSAIINGDIINSTIRFERDTKDDEAGKTNTTDDNAPKKNEDNSQNDKNWITRHPWLFTIITGSVAAIIGGLVLHFMTNPLPNKSQSTEASDAVLVDDTRNNSAFVTELGITDVSAPTTEEAYTTAEINSKWDELNPGPDILNPIEIFVEDKQQVGDWYYFIYKTDLTDNYLMPVLYRSKDMEEAERVSLGSCSKYIVKNNCVYYVDAPYLTDWHGELYVSRPDGKNERLIEDEIYYFDIVGEYIYFTYSFDTVGVGIDNHAMHRMNLDGSNKIIVAYECDIYMYGGSHFEYRVDGEWVYCKGNNYDNDEDLFRIKMDAPATGVEKVELLLDTEDEWIYYTTNKLIKAKYDGSELIVLDDTASFNYSIYEINDEWIYYHKENNKYKIRKDGTDKTLIE